MKRHIIVGYVNDITYNGTINSINTSEADLLYQIPTNTADNNGYASCGTLELLRHDDHGYLLVRGSMTPDHQFSRADAFFPLYIGDSLSNVRTVLQNLLNSLPKE